MYFLSFLAARAWLPRHFAAVHEPLLSSHFSFKNSRNFILYQQLHILYIYVYIYVYIYIMYITCLLNRKHIRDFFFHYNFLKT